MNILHISDNHGAEFRGAAAWYGGADVILHTGDLMPNNSRSPVGDQHTQQSQWLIENAPKIIKRLRGRPFLYVPGNYDYLDPCWYLRDQGADAHNLYTEGAKTVNGVQFYGFPFVPMITGDRGFERAPADMWSLIAPLKRLLDDGKVDVLAAHAPIYGVLDQNSNGVHFGSAVIRQVLEDVRVRPRLYAHGQIHEAHGIVRDWNGMTVSNAATTVNWLTLPDQC